MSSTAGSAESVAVEPTGPARAGLGVGPIVFLVLAAAAPLSAIVGQSPLSVALGNGAGTPGAYLLAGVVLLCFAAGYAAMSGYVTNAGAFYAYITRGLGRLPGSAAAYVAVVSYGAVTIGLFGAFGYFAHLVAESLVGFSMPWQLWTALAFAVTAVLGFLDVSLSAKVLGVALVCEVLVLLVLDVVVLVQRGPGAFSFTSFAPDTVFSGASGVAFLCAFGSFIGFEATAIFSEESRDPHRTVPRATYVAVGVIAVFYTVTNWAVISGYGADKAQAAAAADPGAFVFGLSQQYAGTAVTDAMQVLLVTSLFAAVLALHNASSRYLFALGRSGLLPHRLSQVHPRHQSPYLASLTMSGISALVLVGFALAGADPYLGLASSLVGLGTLGIVALQAATATSVVVFFRRRRDRRWFTTALAPAAGAVGLAIATVLIIDNYAVLTGSSSGWANQLPWALPVVALAGVTVGLRLKGKSPSTFHALGADGHIDAAAAQSVPA